MTMKPPATDPSLNETLYKYRSVLFLFGTAIVYVGALIFGGSGALFLAIGFNIVWMATFWHLIFLDDEKNEEGDHR